MDELETRFSDEREGKWDCQIEEALLRAASEPPPASVLRVHFDELRDMICIAIDDGSMIEIPRGNLQGVASATPEQARDIEIIMLGTGINWPQLDMPFSLEGLREGRYGNDIWMAEWAERRRHALQKAS